MADAKAETIHEAFEIQAASTPDAVAVSFDCHHLTYDELNTRANRLARQLRLLGIGPGSLVGLCVDRSLEMIVGILGILKAGGAYLPLDPLLPGQRLSFMLEEAEVDVLVTQQRVLCNLIPANNEKEAGAKRITLCLDSDWGEIARNSPHNLPRNGTGGNLAYLIYTSGSTGKPKGVLVTHHNVLRLFTSTAHWYDFGPGDVWTLFHSFAFDFSVWELWGALLHGGRLVVVPYMVSRSPAAFRSLLAREKVTVLNQTPSAFRQLIWADEATEEINELNLRFVILGGEALELQSLKPWFDRHGDHRPRLVNMYGITETTVHVTYRPITAADLASGCGSVIGVPIPDLQLYLLDDGLRPMAIGAEGELFVGGAGLARGYLKRADLTAERFVPNPFTGEPEDRLYRTGDLVRLRHDGELEYIGRCDDQVKIRGFRIELGEIQAVLNQHPQVRDSVVTMRDGDRNDGRLIAYLATRPPGQPTVSDLREFLKERLPEHMVPSIFLFLEKLPLTPNGKVDKKHLPNPDHARPDLRHEFAPPLTVGERSLADIWSEILEVQPVGADDSFFELGGDSIRAIQILSRAKERGLCISLAELFEYPTIRKLSQIAEQKSSAPETSGRLEPFGLLRAEDRRRLPPGLEDAYPLLGLQGGMFYHNERYPQSAAYHDVFTFQVVSPFDEAKLKTTIDRFVTRHPPMRTSFDLGTYSQPLQLVHELVEVPFFVLDSRCFTPDEQVREIVSFIDAEKRRSFDRAKAPLMRIGLQRTGEQEFRLIISFHHSILDGWSLASMVTEILTEYGGMISGSGDPIQAPRVHYREHVELEQRTLASEECRNYWAGKMRDPDFQRLPRWPDAYRTGGTEQVRGPEVLLPSDLLEDLKNLAHTAGVPLKSVLQAAHYRVMSFLLGKSDVISGTVANGRPEQIDGERMIGLLLNVVPLRMRLSGGTWLDLVRRTFEAERELLPYRRYPVAELVRIAGGQPLFESAFDFVHFHVYRNLDCYKEMGFHQSLYFEANSFTFFTTFMLDVSCTHLQFHIDFDPGELCPEQIRRISGYYENVLRAMAMEPGSHYELFSPLPSEERKQILVEWNASALDYPRTKCLHELVEDQALRTPNEVAVLCGEQSLTYAQLDDRANRLASRLRAMGVGPEVPVGLFVERSARMPVAMLGILKAGGAYVPLDLSSPGERLALILRDTGATVLVTESGLVPRLAECQAKSLCLDLQDVVTDVSQSMPPARVEGRVRPSNLAYLIYTSGSTGEPKGVAIEHRSAVAFVHWAQTVFSLEELSGVLASTSICFDLSIFEIFVTLSCGGKVILVDNALQLADLPCAREVTLINSVPSAAKELLEFGAIPSSVRVVNLAGEPLTADLVRKIHELSWIEKVYDLYGPTETTTYSSFALRRPDGPVTIGRPVANTQIYLLDSHCQPVPVGTPGEIYIAGDGLARGYLHQPDWTASRFLPNPFSDQAEARFYRTGDQARFLPDGNIQFIGRIDHQIKIRGYRIEPGEVEAALRRHPDIQDSMVMPWCDNAGALRLVAYFVSPQLHVPRAEELREFLRRVIPEYMIPNLFVALPELPLTSNGKVDRHALPVPDQCPSGALDTFIAPRNPVEEFLADIWASVLQLERIGINDNFFDIGGDSLRATQAIARIRTLFELNIPLRCIFDSPTIAGLALVVRDCSV